MKTITSALITLTLLISIYSAAVGAPSHLPQGDVLYVKEGGTSATCSGWTDSCDLQYALSLAGATNEVWVAAGTYYPSDDNDRTVSFALESGVAIYGGFPAAGGDWTSRDWLANTTKLSGDIGTIEDRTDNSYQIVTASSVDNTAILDGFTITAAYRYGLGSKGGGMSNDHSSPTLSNLVFSGNYAFLVGGGMYNVDSSPTLDNVTFTGNEAFYYYESYGGGGGMYNERSSPILTNVSFSENTASNYFGGGMYNVDSSPTLVNVTFEGNSTGYGGGGGMYNLNSDPTLTNVTFSANTGQEYDGGGMNNDNSSPVLTNVTFYNNTAGRGSGIFDANNSSPTLTNAIVWGTTTDLITNNDTSTATISYSIIQGGYTGAGNIDADPLLQELSSNGGLTQTHALFPGSPAIDQGSAAQCPATDQRGYQRPVDGDDDGTPACDIGAYEIQYKTWYAKQDSTAMGCDSWANACGDLQDALALAAPGDQVWVAEGTYTPHTSDRSATFQLESFVKIYGGFLGNETSLTQRDWVNNLTVLSGEINDTNISTDNSNHVVTGSGADSNALLDGFTVSSGYSPDGSYGGGMFNNNGSPTLNNLIISNNRAYWGGGMYNEGSSPALTDVTFSNNTSPGPGAGMYNTNSNPSLTSITFSNNLTGTGSAGGGMYNVYSSPSLTDVIFSGNTGFDGGGMYNTYSSPTLTNVAFIGNYTVQTGNANGGGIYNYSGSSPILTNVLFSGNSASPSGGQGGGMYTYGGDKNVFCNPVLTNVTFYNNSAYRGGGMSNIGYSSPVLANITVFSNSATDGGGIVNTGISTSTLLNTIVWGNTAGQVVNYTSTPSISYSIIQDGCPAGATCSNILSDDPLLSALADYGGFTQTLALTEGSPAIDTGNPDPATCTATDQRGFKRPVDGDGDGVNVCDMGAYEYGATDEFFISLPLIFR